MKIANQRPGTKMGFTLGPFTDGLNEKAEPGDLTATELRVAQNVLLDDVPGRVTKRYGNRVVALMSTGLPARYQYTFNKDDGTSYCLLSDGAQIEVTTDFITHTTLITGLDDAAYMQFETAEGKCWIFNGSDADMWFDGTRFVVMDREYGKAVVATAETGTDQTHIVDTHLTQADDYWNDRLVVITGGTYKGMEGRVTDFDAATDKLTISGFTANPGLVTYMVGLIMPKGRICRYADGHFFIGGTTENRSEIRFNRNDDPDTGYQMSLDNPRAWPDEHQLEITQDDGDQVWTFSPAHRSRVLVSKGTAIYRLEPDATYYYRPVLVSAEVGCRYPDAWAVKDELLYFMGNERSGLLDLYMTDLVSVKPRHKDGRLLPSFEGIRRSEPTGKYIARASAGQFETGEKSTTCKVSAGRIECRKFSTDTDWQDVINTLYYMDQNHDALAIAGIPKWTVNYNPLTSTGGAGNPNDLPAAAVPVWTKVSVGASEQSINYGGLYLKQADNTGGIGYNRSDVLDGSKNTFASIRFKLGTYGIEGAFAPSMTIALYNGVKHIRFCALYNQELGDVLFMEGTTLGHRVAINVPAWTTAFHTLSLLLDKDGNYKLWINGQMMVSGAAVSDAANNRVHFGLSLMEQYNYRGDAIVEKISYDNDFTYNCAGLIDQMVDSAMANLTFDYTRTPEAYGKLFITATLNGGTMIIQTQSSDLGVTYSGLYSLTNGGEPGVDNGMPKRRFLRVQISLVRFNYATGPTVDALILGALWRMKAQQVGSNITAWLKWADDTTTPAGTTATKKIRVAKTLTPPVEGDFGAWAAVVDGDNIGTILTDVIPDAGVPAGEGRWIDAKVELNPSAAGVTPDIENLYVNWQEGTLIRLMLTAFMYRKRLYIAGISTTSIYNDLLFVLDTNNAWTKFAGQNINKMFTFHGLVYGLSSIDDKIFQLEVEGNFNDGAVPVDAYIEPGALDFGNQRFELKNIKIGNAAVSSSVAVYLSYDGTTWTLIGTRAFTGAGTYNMRVPHGRIGKQHFIRLRVAGQEAMGVTMVKAAGKFLAEQ